jgi:putative iron-only hydrogenase system regulator
MEKRIGAIIILVEDRSRVPQLNTLFTEHCDIILGRQGVPLHGRGISLISLIVEGTTDEIGALTGKIGRLKNIKVKSVLTSCAIKPE